MKVEFELNYRVAPEEHIWIEFENLAVPMQSCDGEWWRLTIEVDPQNYIYIVRRGDREVRREMGSVTRNIESLSGVEMVIKHDRWRVEEESRLQ
ncbi:MAG: hypothetical protein SNG45_09070, partial [Rikenellaceae bacterium]